MSHPHVKNWPGHACARRFAEVLFAEPGTVVELRAIGVEGVYGKGIVSGYFDNVDDLVASAGALDGKAKGIFVTLNPVDPALLARAKNRVEKNPKATTSDSDISRRCNLLIDVDPKRASGISATNEEQVAAFRLLKEIGDFLASLGFPAPIKALSGNGGHLAYSTDLPVEDGGLISRVLAALAFRFNTSAAEVDLTVHNPARISKLYGTMACKGDSTVDRPHRRSKLVSVPEVLEAVPRELLERVAAMLPQQERGQSPGSSTNGDRIDVPAFIAKHNLQVARESDWQGGHRWVLGVCPFNSDHDDNSAFILQFATGAVAAGCLHNGCTGQRWPELRGLLEPSLQNLQNLQNPSNGSSAGFAGSFQGDSQEFPEPIPLPEELPPVMKFDPQLLPDEVRDRVVDIADRVQCPIDFVAGGLMVGLAGVIGKRVGIRPKRHDDWLVVPNLWGMAIGRASAMKTPAVKEALRPLNELEADARRDYEASMKRYEASELVSKARTRMASKEIEDAISSGKDPQRVAERALSKDTEKPVRARYIVNDTTMEKLGEILNENPNGITAYRDELVGFLKGLDKDGQECARAFYLEAWTGKDAFTFDRIGRGTIDIETTTVSIFGTIQPGPLGVYLQQANQLGKGDDGLIQRFQVAVWPDPGRTWKNVDRLPDVEAAERTSRLFERLATLTGTDVGAKPESSKPGAISYLRFTNEAQDAFDNWRQSLEDRLLSGEEHPAVESHFAKYRSLLPSLALIIHLASGKTGPVGLEAVDKAMGWIRYLGSHAKRMYSAASNPEVALGRALLKKIHAGKLESPFTQREVYQKGWSLLSTALPVSQAVGVLVEHDWIFEEVVQPSAQGGRTTTRYIINPRALASEDPIRPREGPQPQAQQATVSVPAPDGPENSESPPNGTCKTGKTSSAGFAGSFSGGSETPDAPQGGPEPYAEELSAANDSQWGEIA